MHKIEILRDIAYGEAGEKKLLLDLYIPEGKQEFRLMIFFYGGGLEGGAKEDLALLAEEFAQEGIAVALPNYRLFPEVSYPEFIEDTAKAAGWLRRHAADYFRCSGYFVGGHSAGAYLAMMLCFDKSFLAAQELDSDEDFNGYVFCSGQPTAHFNVLKYRGEDERRVVIDKTAPLYHIRSKGAPLQIICTDNDIQNRLEQTQLLVSTLKYYEYGSEVDFQLLQGYDHGNYLDRPEKGHSKFFDIASVFIRRNSSN